MRFSGLVFLAIFCAVIFGSNATAQQRGIEIKYKAREAADAPVAGSVNLYPKSYALVIGNDRYTNGWASLSNAISDAKSVGRALEKNGFQVTIETNLTAKNFAETIEDWIFEYGGDKNARLFIWYAGHGHTDSNGEGYLVPVDAPLPVEGEFQFRRSAINMRDFGKWVRLVNSKHVLAVFDSCFAGTIFDTARAAPPPAITLATTQPVRQFLTSGDADQTVSDDGTFSRLFIEALQGKRRADLNLDGYLTASELGLFMFDRITNYSNQRQTPRYGKLSDPDYDQGDFVFLLSSSIARATDAAEFENNKSSQAAVGYLKSAAKEENSVDFSAIPNFLPRDLTHNTRGTQFRLCADCPQMSYVPSGKFAMGSNRGEVNEKPLHLVEIDYGLAISTYEITIKEWQVCVNAGACEAKKQVGDNKPVSGISWYEAKKYADWLSNKTKLKLRLPSEAEWEYAARAGTKTRFHYGRTIDNSLANFIGTGGKDIFRKKAPVGTFKPNQNGLFDVHGNVWEWTQDCYSENYFGASRKGLARSGCGEGDRVLRGGSYKNRPSFLTSSFRFPSNPSRKADNVGFRIVLEVEEK